MLSLVTWSSYQLANEITDSQVVLHWVGRMRSALKLWVRNRVIEINRLTDASVWRYVESRNMPADIGTRRGVKISDVGPGSDWICGRSWMRTSEDDFPLKTATELVLSAAEWHEAKKECVVDLNDTPTLCCDLGNFEGSVETPDVGDNDNIKNAVYYYKKSDYDNRYKFSGYIIDPLKYRFRKVLRVLALVFLYISKLKKNVNQNLHCVQKDEHQSPEIFRNQGDKYILTTGSEKFQGPLKCPGGLVITLPNDMITLALQYFYRKATNEVFEFVDKNRYEKISEVENGILYYSGRILSTQGFGGDASLCEAALDLTSSSFCVPLTDSNSPIARAIVNEVHWHHFDVRHGGVESVLRLVQRIMYIVGGGV